MRIKHFLFSAFLFFLSACELQALPGIKLNCDPKTDASCGGEVTKTPPDDGGDDGGDGEVDPPPSVDPVPPKVDLSDCEPAPGGGPFVPLYRGFKDSFGYPRVQINPGEKQTYCFKIEDDRPRFSISLIDSTGTAQCFSHRAIFYPPVGSGLEVHSTSGRLPPSGWWTSLLEGGWLKNSSSNWWRPNWIAPKGVWKVTLQLRPDLPSSCGVFSLYAH